MVWQLDYINKVRGIGTTCSVHVPIVDTIDLSASFSSSEKRGDFNHYITRTYTYSALDGDLFGHLSVTLMTIRTNGYFNDSLVSIVSI